MLHEEESPIDNEETEASDEEKETVTDDETAEHIHIEWAGFI